MQVAIIIPLCFKQFCQILKEKKAQLHKNGRRKRQEQFCCPVSIPLDAITVLNVSIATCRFRTIPKCLNEGYCSSLQEPQCKLVAFYLLPPRWVLLPPDAPLLHLAKFTTPLLPTIPSVGITFNTPNVSMDFGMTVVCDKMTALANWPSLLMSPCELVHVLTSLDSCSFCVGNPDSQLVDYVRDRKGTIKSLADILIMYNIIAL